jgi:hypothetical protein
MFCGVRSRIRDDLVPKSDPVSTYDREKTGNGNEKRRLELNTSRKRHQIGYSKLPLHGEVASWRRALRGEDCASRFELARLSDETAAYCGGRRLRASRRHTTSSNSHMIVSVQGRVRT